MKANILPLMTIFAIVLPLTIAMSGRCEADGTSPAPSPPKFQQTRKICQLTGDIDLGTPGSAGPATGMILGGGNYGITGTDIGWSFEHGNQLSFMFGDTRDFSRDRCDPAACGVRTHPQPVWPDAIDLWQDWTGPNPQDLSNPNMYRDWLDTHGDAADSWASAAAGSDPEACVPLQVARDRTGNHRSTLLNGRIMPRQEGAFSGFSDGNNIYAFVTRKSWPIGCPDSAGCAHDDPNDPGGKMALALSRDGGATFDEIVHFSTTHFQFVAPNVVNGNLLPELLPGLSSHNFLLAFGAGRSRIDPTHMTPWNKSYPFLAISDVPNVTNKAPTVDGVAAFAHRLSWNPNTVDAPVALAGPAIGLAREDKWILPYNDRALIIRSDGYVWYQTISLTGVGGYNALPPRVQPSGYVPLVAVNPLDKWVVPDPKRNRLMVVTADGRVFAHLVTDHIEVPYQLSTPAPVAARPEDNWVLVVGDRLIVITKRGLVYGYQITGPDGKTLAPATMLSDPADPDTLVAGTVPPATPTERWVFADGDNIMTVTGRGVVYAHHIVPVQVPGRPAVEKWQWFSGYQQVGWSDNDRWLLPIHSGSRDDLLVAITYKATGFRYLHLDPNGQPSLVGDEAWASPLWSDAHECVGYFSVRYLEPLKEWVALYTCATNTVPRGVYLRVASKPWGPWSSPVAVMMVSGTENPYCNYMHLPAYIASCPTGAPNPFEDEKRVSQGQPSEPGRRNAGGEYAPFLLPSNYHKYFANGTTRLYFTLSTWNPYQTVLMATDVGLH
jgi:Domain of unknown function (DUF4185)